MANDQLDRTETKDDEERLFQMVGIGLYTIYDRRKPLINSITIIPTRPYTYPLHFHGTVRPGVC